MDSIAELQTLLDESGRIIFFTGAGISTESGIPDYRSPGTGLWRNLGAGEGLGIDDFNENPAAFYETFTPLYDVFRNAQPNSGHSFMARMQQTGRLKSVITQNIDGLHARAGSVIVRELHGTLETSSCMKCGMSFATKKVFRWVSDGMNPPLCPSCNGVIKPDVVFFGEELPADTIDNAVKDSMECDLFVVAGSSLAVMPAALMPGYAKSAGAAVVIINNMPTPYDTMAQLVIHNPIGEVISELEAR
ncbi:SIR2 family NAD-dependent protein deacylase [Limisalsivibrio acetivorans]|uniref:SIR2 family NAD-dependent protein deacylase n=1 Tax=Limisalsivibrio acetivorans TaxID=1304888 RepID=UPI0003B77F29|nr:NAD-dependent deacylase [Limisalsivibrio acetivorans]